MMKTITRDTINALMSGNRKYNLKKCGYSDDDIKDGRSLYNALLDIDPQKPKVVSVIKFDSKLLKETLIDMVRNDPELRSILRNA